MIDSHASYSADKLEVGEVIFTTQARHRIDLKCIVVPAIKEQSTYSKAIHNLINCRIVELSNGSVTHIAEYSNRP